MGTQTASFRTLNLLGGGWDVRHQAEKIRHRTCWICGEIIAGKSRRLPAENKWIVIGVDIGTRTMMSAYACKSCVLMGNNEK